MSRQTPKLIELEDVRKSYRMGDADVEALAGVTLSIDRGEYLAIMGPSGSGKSTLMHLLGCLDTPTAGSYRLDGTEVDSLNDEELSALRNRKIAFVFQAFNLISTLTVLENVALPLSYRDTQRANAEERAAGVLASIGLAHRCKHRPNELSGGECQRVAIARALVTAPEVILADEPTGNLDTRTGEEVMEILGGLHDSGTTIVMVTHDPSKARRAKRLVQMQDGRIQRELTGEQKDRVVQQFAAVGELADSRSHDSGAGLAGSLTTAEREEFARLRKRVETLELDLERQGKARAFFAKESE